MESGENRPSQPPLLAFVSSVMSGEFLSLRAEAKRACNRNGIEAWLFEDSPASSESIPDAYLRYVEDSDIFILIVGDDVTEPVRKEVVRAIDSRRPVLAFLLPSDSRSAETEKLLSRLRPLVKYKELADVSILGQEIETSLKNEINRRFRDGGSTGGSEEIRVARLRSLIAQSESRCKSGFRQIGLPEDLAVAWASDQLVGSLPSELVNPKAKSSTLVTGPLGSGKSLLAERVHQKAIDRALTDSLAALPVRFRAMEVRGSLQDALAGRTIELGKPEIHGIALVIDGLDEVGIQGARRLQTEATAIIESYPNSWVVMTCRSNAFPHQDYNVLQMPELNETEQVNLIESAAGRQLDRHETWNWQPAIKDAIRYPLFAIALGSTLRNSEGQRPRTRLEIVNSLIRSMRGSADGGYVLDDRGLEAVATHMLSNGVPPRAAELPSEVDVESLMDTGLVEEQGDRLAIRHQLITDWFGAQAISSGRIQVSDLAAKPGVLDNWYFALSLSLVNGPRAHTTLAELVVTDAALAPKVLGEAADQWGFTLLQEDEAPSAPTDVGESIVRSMKAWVDGLGDLGNLIAPVDESGSLRPLGIKIDGSRLMLSWYRGRDKQGEVILMPTEPIELRTSPVWGTRWVTTYLGDFWPWSWSLEVLQDRLQRVLEDQSLPYANREATHEAAWNFSRLLIGRGEFYSSPIALDEVESALVAFSGQTTPSSISFGYGNLFQSNQLASITEFFRDLAKGGESEIRPPWPGQDIDDFRSGLITSFYSREQLRKRVEAVYDLALGIYESLVDRWFSTLKHRLLLRATMPVRFVGDLVYGDQTGEPWLDYETFPQQFEDNNLVEISVSSTRRGYPDWEARWRKKHADLREARPDAAAWIYATEGTTALHVFGSTPGATMAYQWLRDDLRRIGWLKH